jgi:hypothetical protein
MRKTLGCVAAVAVMLAVAATVQGGETDRAAYDFKLSAKRPSAPSAMSIHVLFKDPEDPEAAAGARRGRPRPAARHADRRGGRPPLRRDRR